MSNRHRILLVRLFLIVGVVWSTPGICPPGLAQDGVADPAIPTPESFFGFADGEWHVRHDRLLAYLSTLARASDRITFEQYGSTYEQRSLALLVVTHPDNHNRLEALRAEHLLLSDPDRSGTVDITNAPMVLWMGFSVHGNEASGANAVSRIAYHLASARGQAIDEQLRNLIIILDPCINPDGYDRFTTWVNGNRGMQPSADPATREHTEPWPGGRGNHYWFDLNRDYLPLVHQESRTLMHQYYRWMPNLLLDFHEMGTSSTYFFQPGKQSAVHPLIPESNRVLTRKLAERFARAMDARGSLYFTEEIFDDFFVGKASTYTDVSGSVGILFEQASARGHRQEHPQGVITFPFAIGNHVTSALTAVRAAANLRREFLDHQRSFFRTAVAEAKQSPVQAYLIGSASDPWRVYQLAELLRRHQIRVHELAAPLTSNGLTFVPGSALLVDVRQPQFRLLSALFEVRTEFTDSIFYDISAWTLPYAYGLRFAAVRSVPDRVRGTEITDVRFPRGSLTAPLSPAAYAFAWGQHAAPAVVGRLLNAGALVRVAMRPFRAETGVAEQPLFTAGSGTIVVPLGLQRDRADTIAAILNAAATNDGLHITGISTGLTPEGIDLGSDQIRNLALPRVLIAAGPGVSSADAGEAWYLLDQRVGLEVTLADPAQFGRIALNRYTSVILPGGSYGSVDSAGTDALREWVENGGTLVAQENAIEWLIRSHLSSLSVKRPSRGPENDSSSVRRLFGDLGKAEASQMVSGAILAATVDRTHPLGFGMDSTMLPLCRTSTLLLNPPRDPYATPLTYTSAPVLSGYVPRTLGESLKNTPAVVVTMQKRGRIVHIADSPAFRGFWLGSERLLINAVFFGPLMRTTVYRGERE